MNVAIAKAPSTPLNLRMWLIYEPRVPTPPFVGFQVVEPSPNRYRIVAYAEDGTSETVFLGDLLEAFRRLASHLRMDV